MAENDSLSVKQEQFLTAYLATGNVGTAALTCKINESTGYRWLKLESVQQALKKAQKHLFESELGELRRIVSKAIRALERNLENTKDVPPSTQVAAARIVLDTAIAIYRTDELDQRITELEDLIGQ